MSYRQSHRTNSTFSERGFKNLIKKPKNINGSVIPGSASFITPLYNIKSMEKNESRARYRETVNPLSRIISDGIKSIASEMKNNINRIYINHKVTFLYFLLVSAYILFPFNDPTPAAHFIKHPHENYKTMLISDEI